MKCFVFYVILQALRSLAPSVAIFVGNTFSNGHAYGGEICQRKSIFNMSITLVNHFGTCLLSLCMRRFCITGRVKQPLPQKQDNPYCCLEINKALACVPGKQYLCKLVS